MDEVVVLCSSPCRLAAVILKSFGRPPPSPDREVDYIDGDPENCRLANLRWETPRPLQPRPCIRCRRMFDSADRRQNQLCGRCTAAMAQMHAKPIVERLA